MFTTTPLTQQPWKTPKLNGVSEKSPHIIADENAPFIRCKSKKVLYLIALRMGKFVGAFQKNIPHIEAFGKGKTAPPFSNFTAREQKEKAAIAAW